MTNQQLRQHYHNLAEEEFRDEILIFGRENPFVNYGVSRYVETMITNTDRFLTQRGLDRLTHGFDLKSRVAEATGGRVC